MSRDALSLLAALVLEDGAPWGRKAEDWQWTDARAVVERRKPRSLLLRARGRSKTTDVAGMALALMVTEAPRRARGYILATDEEQAGLFIDAIAGFVDRTPALRRAVRVDRNRITVLESKATLTVLSSDARSAFGRRAWLFIVDELGEWPSTRNHQRLWTSIVTGLGKVKDYRFVVMGTAGEPDSIMHRTWESALSSPLWFTAKRPGPPSWWSAEEVAALGELSAAERSQYFDCEFVSGDDALVTLEDVARAVRLAPVPRGFGHVLGLDVGTRRDLTAVAVAHRAGERYEVDEVRFWRPSRNGRVDLSEVEAEVARLALAYGAPVIFDRMQAEQMTQNLDRAGVRTREFVFSTAGANRIARVLATVLSQGRLGIPDEEETVAEFRAVRLVATGPGTVKLRNPAGSHDDIVTAIGMAVTTLADQPVSEGAHVTVPSGRYTRSTQLRRSALPGALGAKGRMREFGTTPTGGIVSDQQAEELRRRRSA